MRRRLERLEQLVPKRQALLLEGHLPFHVKTQHLVVLMLTAQLKHTVLELRMLVEGLGMRVSCLHSLLQLTNAPVQPLQTLNTCLLFVDTPHAVHRGTYVATETRPAHSPGLRDTLSIAQPRKALTLRHGRVQVVGEALKIKLFCIALLQ